MHEFTILSKATDYFLARKGQCHCKIIIDEFSQDLPLGVISLHVEEISDIYQHHSKEAIFRLTLPLARQHETAICTLAIRRHNTFLYKRCLALGGQWSDVLNEWVFSASVQEKVDAIAALFKSKATFIEAYLNETITTSNQPLTIGGFPVATATSRSHNAAIVKNVKLMAGDVGVIGHDDDYKIIANAGTTFRLWLPEALINHPDYKEDYLCAVTLTKKRSPRGKPSFMQ